MTNKGHLDILIKGTREWNAWRATNPGTTPSLSLIDLTNVQIDLSGANFVNADLTQARLPKAVFVKGMFYRADLRGANLSETDFSGADLTLADLRGADLRGTIFRDANLGGTQFTGAYLSCTVFTGATTWETVFGSVDLRAAVGLDDVKHAGHSVIDFDTIIRSEDRIPDSFLRGAGVPEKFITFMKSLTGAAFEFYSCFISYCTKDQEFADRLYADLQAQGVRCWFAPHDIQGGRKVHEQIDEAIRIYDKLLLILSDASMTSNWVKTEIANARAREQQQHRQMLFPISVVPFEAIRAWKCFDADTGIDSAREIREYFVPDFSNWKDHDAYARAFERLLRDLKARPAQRTAAESGA